jgi:predicted nucleic acid-binding protein
MTRWVVDASPLIFLAKLERLALLHQSSGEVYVPPQVLAEIRAQRDSSVGAIEQGVHSWLRVKAPRREKLACLSGARPGRLLGASPDPRPSR